MREQIISKLKKVVHPTDPVKQVEQLKKILKLTSSVDTNELFHYISDRRTKRVILVHNDYNIISSLAKLPNTHVCYNLTLSSVIGAKRWIIPEQFDYACPWNYEDGTQLVYQNECKPMSEPISYDTMYDYFLVHHKALALEVIFGTMQMLNGELGFTKDPLQMFIYQEKYNQAVRVLNGDLNNVDYVEKWAEIKGYDLNVAAKDIKLHYDMMHQKLSKLEYTRLLFTEKVLKEDDALKLPYTLADFRMFNFGYMKL